MKKLFIAAFMAFAGIAAATAQEPCNEPVCPENTPCTEQAPCAEPETCTPAPCTNTEQATPAPAEQPAPCAPETGC